MKLRSTDLRDRATDLKDQWSPHVEAAVAKAGPALADARDKATPLVQDAADKAKERWQHDVLPAINAAAAAAEEATSEYRAEAKRRGTATAAALKGEVEPPKKKRRLRKLLLIAGLGGIAFAAVRRLTAQESTAWENSYQPTPAPAPAPARPAEDTAAATPDEALADAAESPHAATTPDQPAETVDLDDKR